ncbi:hypothetical protein GCM10017667_72040 [Streptomyces filamentosus]|uniref:Uncharacterized protein n=1 Tax=Streptomyces filamentosus TaxID=67294 RepID=A0A919BX78_STRFL|nr:hypothetical protein GCM10017667_72040 [Streptomyces filamentosus]
METGRFEDVGTVQDQALQLGDHEGRGGAVPGRRRCLPAGPGAPPRLSEADGRMGA